MSKNTNLWIGPAGNTSTVFPFEITVVDSEGNTKSVMCTLRVGGSGGGGGGGGGGGLGLTGIDIGSPEVAGTTTEISSTSYTVAGGSTTDFTTHIDLGSAEAFQFAYASASGDTTITGRLVNVANSPWMAGLMVRTGLTDDSTNVFLTIYADINNNFYNIGMFWRTPDGAGGQQGYNSGRTAQVVSSGVLWPVYLRLVVSLVGTAVDAYWSTDGTTWQHIGQVSVTLGTSFKWGIAANSAQHDQTTTVLFDSLSITHP